MKSSYHFTCFDLKFGSIPVKIKLRAVCGRMCLDCEIMQLETFKCVRLSRILRTEHTLCL